jgi:hypothetical protein
VRTVLPCIKLRKQIVGYQGSINTSSYASPRRDLLSLVDCYFFFWLKQVGEGRFEAWFFL